MHTHNKEHKHHTRDITPSNMIFAIIICDSVVAPSSLSYCTVPSISQLSLSLSLSLSLCLCLSLSLSVTRFSPLPPIPYLPKSTRIRESYESSF